jgi:hypothetical protein
MFKFGMISSSHIPYYELITIVEALEIVFWDFLVLLNEISCYRKVCNAWRCELADTDGGEL